MQTGGVVNVATSGSPSIGTTLTPPDQQQYGHVVIFNSTEFILQVVIAGTLTDWLQPNYANSFSLPTPTASVQVIPQTPTLGALNVLDNVVYIGLVTSTWYLRSEPAPTGYPLPLTANNQDTIALIQGINDVGTTFTAASPTGTCSINGNATSPNNLPPFLFTIPSGVNLVGLIATGPNAVCGVAMSGIGISVALKGYSTGLVTPYVAIPNTGWSANLCTPFILSTEFNIEDINDTIFEILVQGQGLVGGPPGFGTVVFNNLSIVCNDPHASLQNLIGELYIVPTVPSILAGDHPPNEVQFISGTSNASGAIVLPAPGNGKRYRVFSITASLDVTGAYNYNGGLLDTGNNQFLVLFNNATVQGFLTLQVNYGPSGYPLSNNGAIETNNNALGLQLTWMITYTLETI